MVGAINSPGDGDPVHIPNPKSWTKAQKKQIYESTKGICVHCGLPVDENEEWHASHKHGKSRAITGSNDIKDLGPGHAACNLKHYYEFEQPLLKKAKRQEKYNNTGRSTARKGQKIAGRKLPGGKDDKWKMAMTPEGPKRVKR